MKSILQILKGKNDRGYSLLEISIGLVIATVISFGLLQEIDRKIESEAVAENVRRLKEIEYYAYRCFSEIPPATTCKNQVLDVGGWSRILTDAEYDTELRLGNGSLANYKAKLTDADRSGTHQIEKIIITVSGVKKSIAQQVARKMDPAAEWIAESGIDQNGYLIPDEQKTVSIEFTIGIPGTEYGLAGYIDAAVSQIVEDLADIERDPGCVAGVIFTGEKFRCAKLVGAKPITSEIDVVDGCLWDGKKVSFGDEFQIDDWCSRKKNTKENAEKAQGCQYGYSNKRERILLMDGDLYQSWEVCSESGYMRRNSDRYSPIQSCENAYYIRQCLPKPALPE